MVSSCLRSLLCASLLYSSTGTTTTRNVFTFCASVLSAPLTLCFLTHSLNTVKAFGSVADKNKELGALALWNESWNRAGWNAQVIGQEDARRSPRYEHYLSSFYDLPTVNRIEYEVSCYMRWVAMSVVAGPGAVMTDYDVLNVAWQPQEVPEKLRVLEGIVPAVVIGSAAEFERVAEWFAAFKVPESPEEREAEHFVKKDGGGQVHLSDMILVQYAVRKLGIIDSNHTAFGFGEVGGEYAPLIHFSHSAVHAHGGGKSRNELMREALDAVEQRAEAAQRGETAPPSDPSAGS